MNIFIRAGIHGDVLPKGTMVITDMGIHSTELSGIWPRHVSSEAWVAIGFNLKGKLMWWCEKNEKHG